MPEGIGYGNNKPKRPKVGKNVSKSRAHPSQKKKNKSLLKSVFRKKDTRPKNVKKTEASKEVKKNRRKKVSTGGFGFGTKKLSITDDLGKLSAKFSQSAENIPKATNEKQINKAIEKMSLNQDASQVAAVKKADLGKKNRTFKQKRKKGRIVFN